MPRPRLVAYGRLVLLVACCAAAGWAALRLGQDANWDLQNYHFYDPWAWLSGRLFDRDVAAAQLQTFHNPLADVPFYTLVAHDVDPRLITLWLALPTGFAAWLLLTLAWRLFRGLATGPRAGASAASLAIGVTGAMSVAQLGTTTGEWPVAAFALGALVVGLRALGERGGAATRALVLSGLLAGVASGVKLTAATYALALCVALLAQRAPWRRNARAASAYACGALAGIGITLGPWMLALWTHFRNPLFPYGNQWFRSPWWELHQLFPRFYGPRKLGDWLLFPFRLLSPPLGYVSEVPYVDARFPLLFALALILAGGAVLAWNRRPAPSSDPDGAWRFVGVFFAAAFIAWTALFSVLRYTIPLEMLSGILIVRLVGWLFSPRYAAVAVALAVAGVVGTTSQTDWGRVAFARRWFVVNAPPIAPGALIVLTVDAPISYVLPFLPSDARFVAIRNNIVDPAQHNRLTERIATIVREHHGPLYSLGFPAGAGRAALDAHRLRPLPGTCAEVRTNMPASPIELCRLERVDRTRP